MTEFEKMQRAKMYIDKLANGINPLTDTVAPEDDIVNNVRLSRCFFYVSDILRQVIENDGNIKKTKKEQKFPFTLTSNQRALFIPSDKPIAISEIAKNLNGIADLEKCKKMSYSLIANWLVSIGALEIHADINGKSKKCPTAQGNELGIKFESRTGLNGEYQVVVCDSAAQQFIVDNIDAITLLDQNKANNVAEKQGQPWTHAQDECLIELFNKKIPLSEIAITLMRTETGIRARLKRLGLIEKRSEI